MTGRLASLLLSTGLLVVAAYPAPAAPSLGRLRMTRPSAYVAPPALAPLVADQTVTFGRLTLANAGGVEPINGGGAVTSASCTGANAAHWNWASGRFSPTSAGVSAGLASSYALSCTFTNADGSDGAAITIETEADTYSVADYAELDAVNDLAVATLSGKTIKLRYNASGYAWPFNNNAATLFRNKAFTSEVVVTSHETASAARYGRFLIGQSGAQSRWLVGPTNLTFRHLWFDAPFPAGGDVDGAGLVILGDVNSLTFSHVVISGNLRDYVAAGTGDSFTVGWRGLLAFNSAQLVTGGMEISDSLIYGSWRLINLGGGTGPMRILRNEFRDFGVDGIFLAGAQPDLTINDNIIWRPLSVTGLPKTVASIDLTTDQVTFTAPHGFPIGETITVNFLPGSTVLPGGVSAMTDYSVAVIDEDTIDFSSPNITSQGTGVLLAREAPHADAIQFTPSTGVAFNFQIARNVICACRDDGIAFVDEVQGIFGEDNNGAPSPDTTHYHGIADSNVVYTRSNYGIAFANSYNTHIINNTVIAPTDAVAGVVPPIRFFDHNSGTRAGNVARNNISAVVSVLPSSGGVIANNITAFPDAIDTGATERYSDVFINPGLPTTPDQLLAMYALKPGGPADTASPKLGAIGAYADFDANTSASPSAPADITGPVLSAIGGAATGATTAALSATTDTAEGTLYWVVSPSASRPSPTQMLAGLTAAGAAAPYAGTTAVVGAGAQSRAATGLAGATTYYVHALQIDAAGNYSVVTVSGSFVTN